MNTVNLKEARRRFSELVKAAQHGEATTLTRRGKAVARIVPVEPKPRRGLPDLTEFRKSIKIKGKPMSEEVIEMRREERY
jgi:prevent-host-death family protein